MCAEISDKFKNFFDDDDIITMIFYRRMKPYFFVSNLEK